MTRLLAYLLPEPVDQIEVSLFAFIAVGAATIGALVQLA